MFPEVPGAQGAQIGRYLLDSCHETVQYEPRIYTWGLLGPLNTNMRFKMFSDVPRAQGSQTGRRLLDSYHETVRMSQKFILGGFWGR